MSSTGGQLSFAGFSAYSATKFALEGYSEALADEVAPYGIRVLIVEPGAFRTELFDAYSPSGESETYAGTAGATRAMIRANQRQAARRPGQSGCGCLVSSGGCGPAAAAPSRRRHGGRRGRSSR